MEIRGKNVLVLGGGGMVGSAVCRELLRHRPARIALAARRRAKAEATARQIETLCESDTRIVPVWGDIFMRAEWQQDAASPRDAVLSDPERRRRFVADILDELDEDMIEASLLQKMILGTVEGLEGTPADIVVDCMNTATAVSYTDLYAASARASTIASANAAGTDWSEAIDRLLACMSVPQLVRHVQLLYESMRRARTEAYVKVGTSGTGGMGFNIPYTHGEERPSRLLLSKAAIAGAQTNLTFLMARTPDGPGVVKEVKPTATIAWREIAYGPIRAGGREIPLYDCEPADAVFCRDPANVAPTGEFGTDTGNTLEGVYIDTGENGLFSADEFAAITAPGQMTFLTPEEIAWNVVREITGGNTGRDVVAALDGSVMGPSYRGGYLRDAALARLRQLEATHGPSIAFEKLGPPRLSKLLFEAHLLKRACEEFSSAVERSADELASTLEAEVLGDEEIRRRIISIGIPILLPDGERLLRGPTIKSQDAWHGWVDLTSANMTRWQKRLTALQSDTRETLSGDTSSYHDRLFTISRKWGSTGADLEAGEIAAWIFINEERGQRQKS